MKVDVGMRRQLCIVLFVRRIIVEDDVPWLGRKTEPGLVVYLSAESPASVRSRLQAYQKHQSVKVPNFAIVQSPIDLFDGDADTDKVIQLVRQIAKQRAIAVRLIVGDSLARLSAGANENAGQDMSVVVRHIDRIRAECAAHFALIHHNGKNAAAGSRGWSGVRAAVDTEIEVTDSPSGRCCEITKQRDLSTKGERIGFRLDVVVLGETKWGAPATSCVLRAHPTVAWCERMNSGAVRIGKRFVRFSWKGCPDVLGQLKDGRLLGVEVKADKGRLSPEQSVFLARIRCAGSVAFMAKDLRDVVRELER